MSRDGRLLAVGALVVLAAVLATAFLVGGTAAVGADDAASENDRATSAVESSTTAVSEPAAEVPVPEPGDEYYEAAAPDGSWISYINPRDEYRSPYLGDGSGKICVTLVNEAGEPVVGESVPNTSATISTGEELDWHPYANPLTVEYPVTKNYDRPLDADQFGTSAELPQGDGYLDSHCIEIHGQPEDGTIEYGEVEVTGEHADDIEVVGYIQQANEAWDTDVDPIEDAESYADAGGGWTYEPGGSHGQVVAVLQLTGEAGEPEDGDGSIDGTDDANGTDGSNETHANGTDSGSDDGATDDRENSDGSSDVGDDADGLPGFGTAVAVIALTAVAVGLSRR